MLGLFISDHPLRDYQSKLVGAVSIKDVIQNKTTASVTIGGLVTKVQKIVTKTGKPMQFCWIEDMTSKIELVVFPTIYDQFQSAFVENNIIVVKGKLNDRDGIPKLLCDDVKSIVQLS